MSHWYRPPVSPALIVVMLAACQSTSPPATTDDGGISTGVILDAGASEPLSPDGGASCVVGVCNYQTQEGCAAGSMCHPQLDTDQVRPACVAAGTGSAGESCAWLGCKPGYVCSSDARCRHMCCGGDWSPCEPNESCTGALELLPSGSSTPVPAGVGVCEPNEDCDVFDATSCPSGQSCYIIDTRGGVNCLPSGAADAYEICSSTQLCQAGLICVASSNGVGQCRRLCRAVAGATPACPAAEGTVCAHYASDPPGVGECIFAED